jgi:hypothetical protein
MSSNLPAACWPDLMALAAVLNKLSNTLLAYCDAC